MKQEGKKTMPCRITYTVTTKDKPGNITSRATNFHTLNFESANLRAPFPQGVHTAKDREKAALIIFENEILPRSDPPFLYHSDPYFEITDDEGVVQKKKTPHRNET